MDQKFTVQIQNQSRKVFPTLARAIQYVREINPMWYQLEKHFPDEGPSVVLVAAADSWHV